MEAWIVHRAQVWEEREELPGPLKLVQAEVLLTPRGISRGRTHNRYDAQCPHVFATWPTCFSPEAFDGRLSLDARLSFERPLWTGNRPPLEAMPPIPSQGLPFRRGRGGSGRNNSRDYHFPPAPIQPSQCHLTRGIRTQPCAHQSHARHLSLERGVPHISSEGLLEYLQESSLVRALLRKGVQSNAQGVLRDAVPAHHVHGSSPTSRMAESARY